MEIDNDRQASWAKALLISTPFVLLLGSSLLALFLLIHTWIPTLISGILMFLGWSITSVLKLKSVKFRFEEEMLTILYYPISPMTSNFKRIDTDPGELIRFEIRSSLLGFKKELILYVSVKGEEAAYPPVSVALCNKETIRIVSDYLSAYCSTGASS